MYPKNVHNINFITDIDISQQVNLDSVQKTYTYYIQKKNNFFFYNLWSKYKSLESSFNEVKRNVVKIIIQ